MQPQAFVKNVWQAIINQFKHSLILIYLQQMESIILIVLHAFLVKYQIAANVIHRIFIYIYLIS